MIFQNFAQQIIICLVYLLLLMSVVRANRDFSRSNFGGLGYISLSFLAGLIHLISLKFILTDSAPFHSGSDQMIALALALLSLLAFQAFLQKKIQPLPLLLGLILLFLLALIGNPLASLWATILLNSLVLVLLLWQKYKKNILLKDSIWFAWLALPLLAVAGVVIRYATFTLAGEWLQLAAAGVMTLILSIKSFVSQSVPDLDHDPSAQVIPQPVSERTNPSISSEEKSKSTFISIASHELRTPLTVARGYTEMLLEKDSLPGEERGLIEGIHKSLLRQNEIIETMFDIAQFESHTFDIKMESVSPEEILRSAASSVADAATARRLEIRFDLPQLPYIKADKRALHKLFVHLLSNAIKYTPDNGKILISAQRSDNDPGLEDFIDLVISDSGVGVPRDLQESIFTRFYQPDASARHHSTGKTKFKGSGAGLGLSLSRMIVEAHGGRIWVESSGFSETTFPGSAFHVLLPVDRQRSGSQPRIGKSSNQVIH